LINVSKFYCLFQAFLQSFISLFNLFYGHFPIQFTHFRHFGKLKSLFKQYGLGFLKRKRFLAFTLSKALKAVESGLVILLMQLSRIYIHLSMVAANESACTGQCTNKEVEYVSLQWQLSWGRVVTEIDEAASLTLF
jgi:hypothetical protein